MVKVYGIPNCDIIKKTLDWYKKKNIRVNFFDYKTKGVPEEKLIQWCKKEGWELLLNKKSTTWRNLPPEVQVKVTNDKAAIQLMTTHASIIKRPVIEINDKLIIGFNKTYFTNQ